MENDHSCQRLTNLKRYSKEGSKQKKRTYSSSETSDYTDSSTENSSSDSDTFMSNEDSPNYVCSCCNDNFEENEILYECRSCSRRYHLYCHIPIITGRYEKKIWMCKLCEDMDTISRDLGKNEDAEDLNIGTVGRNIAERILMELYCGDVDSDAFCRVQPHVNIFPSYYGNIVYPSSLNDVRNHLQAYGHRYKLSHFMNDIKLVFLKNMSYFDIGDPSFDNARKLLTNLKTLYNKWVAPSTEEYLN